MRSRRAATGLGRKGRHPAASVPSKSTVTAASLLVLERPWFGGRSQSWAQKTRRFAAAAVWTCSTGEHADR